MEVTAHGICSLVLAARGPAHDWLRISGSRIRYLFFGAGAVAIGLLTWLFPGLEASFPIQILLWATSSSVSLALLRKYFKPVFTIKLLGKNDDDRKSIGEIAHVIEPIKPGENGRVRYHGTIWSAMSLHAMYCDQDVSFLKRIRFLQRFGAIEW